MAFLLPMRPSILRSGYTLTPLLVDHTLKGTTTTSTTFGSWRLHSASPRSYNPNVPYAVQSIDDELVRLTHEMQSVHEMILELNGSQSFNLDSYKQVSTVLFGTPDQSTSRAALEAVAYHKPIAEYILQYRQIKQAMKRLQKKRDQMKLTRTTNTHSAEAVTSATTSRQHDPLILVDTSSLIFRAYFSMPPMHRQDGMPVGAVLGFCNMLNRLVQAPMLNGQRPRLVLCCDAKGKTKRHDMYQEYKANRQDVPLDLIPQFSLIRQAAQAYGMLWVEAPGFEADDVMASLARMASRQGVDVDIYSGDKDLMQLITPPKESTEEETNNDSGGPAMINMVDPMTMARWDHAAVQEKWGVGSQQLGDVLALAGDTADNVPGVPGIGPKIAAQLIQKFGSLENLLGNLDQVKQPKRREKLHTHQDLAVLSQKLVQLECDLDWDIMKIDPHESLGNNLDPSATASLSVEELRMAPMNARRILDFYDEMGFVTIRNRFLEQLERHGINLRDDDESTPMDRRVKEKASGGSSVVRPKAQVPTTEEIGLVPF
eukprot:Nitzschia sp. Nitz4//scaffold151_size53849//1270//2898//NITZ4_006711-RA/size53849-processed-gene-0.68-mRNA-1//-1//CDS//3329537108//8935//frame0